MEFSRDELIIMMLYSPGDRPGLISTLEDMKGQLTGEDKELLNLICSILPKLEAMMHTAVASGHGCGAQRPLCGLTATPI